MSVNGFIGTINNVIGVINKIPGVDIGTIPLLAQGAIATAPTLAMIGEGGEPEAVVPLSRAGEFGFGGNKEVLNALDENNRLMRLLVKQNRDMERFKGFG